MAWSDVAELIKTLGGLVALLGFPLAFFTYRRSVKTKRAELLASLHGKVFEGDRYKEIRRVLDYQPESEYTELVNAVEGGAIIRSVTSFIAT